jgi:hypothetical protein
MFTVVATLTQEELVRWRMAHARLNAIEDKPDAYSPTDVEQAYLTKWKLGEELCTRYSVDDAKDWAISCYTGILFYKG